VLVNLQPPQAPSLSDFGSKRFVIYVFV
jgi:hypothetical protein